MRFHVDPDITLAATLPASFYRDPQIFEELKENVFMKSWQWLGQSDHLFQAANVYPQYFLEHYLDEPILLVNQADGVRCMSNVCTHRGNILVHHPSQVKKITCHYHGRRFDDSGQMEFMPEFKQAVDFPRPCDHLRQFPTHNWFGQLFAGLDPAFHLQPILSKMEERIGFLPLHDLKYRPDLSKDYLISAHWALYCDNYLEGFHVPFVHKDLNDMLDYGSYTTLTDEHLVLQIGYTDDSIEHFKLPEGHPDHGRHVAAYYYWIFPNMMFNFYPWGVSVNVVRPLAINRTKVSFYTFMLDESKFTFYDVNAIDKTEREDEFVVENVHRGLQSRFYQAGRFSPTREQGVHAFHRMLAEAMG